MKFGGTSIQGCRGVERVASILSSGGPGTVAVVSAMAGTTDALLEGAEAAVAGRPGLDQAAAAVREEHLRVAQDLLGEGELDSFSAYLGAVISRYRAYGALLAGASSDARRSLVSCF